MVNDILEFTRGGAPQLILARLDYAAFVSPLIEEIRAEIAPKSVTIENENPPPAVKMPLNPRRLSRAFHNLLGNAVDAMPAGGKIKIRFEVTAREVITEIEDGGAGIAPEIVDHLFEAFVTFGKSRGTGLGLSITQKIIEEHGGKISARNRMGGGAVFSFTLPREPATSVP
jgi:signal transduction histidine kinase